MASKSRSGVNPEQRERFMLDHGYTPMGLGKGSHHRWEHRELKALCRAQPNTRPPMNLLSNPMQKPWEISLNDDPGTGTWFAICKLAEWTAETVKVEKSSSLHQQRRLDFLQQFHKAETDIRHWKKSVKHYFKTGLDLAKAPAPPEAYQDILNMRAQKNQMSFLNR